MQRAAGRAELAEPPNTDTALNSIWIAVSVVLGADVTVVTTQLRSAISLNSKHKSA